MIKSCDKHCMFLYGRSPSKWFNTDWNVQLKNNMLQYHFYYKSIFYGVIVENPHFLNTGPQIWHHNISFLKVDTCPVILVYDT